MIRWELRVVWHEPYGGRSVSLATYDDRDLVNSWCDPQSADEALWDEVQRVAASFAGVQLELPF